MNSILSCIAKGHVQSCLKTKIIYLTTRGLTTQSKTHYDALEVLPNASQNEIKSSYYKLTMRYHPDRNKTELAKRKFQEISDAYEALSNTEKRKIYDKTIFLHKIRSNEQQSHDNRSQMENKAYHHSVNLRSTKVYDIDEWTRKHYEQRFYFIRRERQVYEREKFKYESSNDTDKLPISGKLILFCLLMFFMVNLMRQNHDKTLLEIKQQTPEKEN